MEPPDARIYTLTELGIFIGVVMTSITGTVVAIITAWRTGNRVDAASQKIETIKEKVAEVHELTNSTATRQKDEIAVLTAKVESLTAHIAEQEKNRAVLAAETRRETAPPPAVPSPGPPSAEQVVHVPAQTLPVEGAAPPRIITP